MSHKSNYPNNDPTEPIDGFPGYYGFPSQGQAPQLQPPPYGYVDNSNHDWQRQQYQQQLQQQQYQHQQQVHQQQYQHQQQQYQQHQYQQQQQSQYQQQQHNQKLQQPQDVNESSSENPVNPLIHSPDWSPTSEDYRLMAFPQQDFMTRVKKNFHKKSGDPLVDQPISFLRQVPPHLAEQPQRAFRPLILKGFNKMGLIGEGFKPAYIGLVFAPRDVSVADFGQFLEDIAMAGNINGGSKIGAQVAPATMHMGLTGYFVTKAILKGLHRRKEPLVIRTIEAWQEYFFGPRGLDVYVVAEGERITSQYVNGELDPIPPEVAQLCGGSRGSKHYDSDKSYESDSSIDSNSSRDSNGRKLSHDERKLRKEEIKEKKRLRKKRQEDRKKEHKRNKKLRKSQKEEEKKTKKDFDAPKLVVTALVPGY